MSALTHQVVQGFAAVTCGECGVAFGFTEEFYEKRRQDKRTWHCPNGHVRVFTGKTEADRLREEVELERQRADRAEQGRKWAEQWAKGARISAGKANAARRRLEHRVNCGVCPHCRRTFKQLAAHIKTKHPAAAAKGAR